MNLKRVLIVDDEPTNVRLLRRMLEREGDFVCESTTDPREALRMCEQNLPDIVLLDFNMPYLDGLAILGLLGERFPNRVLFPVIVLTADANPEVKHAALRAGASDFVTKPMDAVEVVLRVRQQLERRDFHAQILEHNESLEARVRERTRELEQAQLEMIDRLAQATELRDDDTGEHVARMAKMTGRIAREMGLEEQEVSLIEQAVRLHDVGKIAVPDSILLKPGRLEPEERAVMQDHAEAGARILSESRIPLLQKAEEIARSHHERWDGGGYPQGLAGEAIPLAARIAAVADVFDALTNARPYKEAWAIERATAEISRSAGTHFDPNVVEAFLSLLNDVSLRRAA